MTAIDDKLVFIVGHYKSGSTWLANLLSLHPDIVGLRETHIFRYTKTSPSLSECTWQLYNTVAWSGGGWRRLARHKVGNILRPFRRQGQATLKPKDRPMTLLDLDLRDQLELRRLLLQSTDGGDYCRRFFEFHLETLEPARYLVEKTPTNIPYVPDIRQVFPNAKLIAIYRDGRDVVVSDRFHLKNEYGREQDLRESISNWRRAVELQLDYEKRYGVYGLSYETLLQDGKDAVDHLLDFLSLDKDNQLIDDLLRRSSFKFVTGRKTGNEDKGDFYRKGVAGDWRRYLEPSELKLVSELAGDLLVRLGYEPSADWKDWNDGQE